MSTNSDKLPENTVQGWERTEAQLHLTAVASLSVVWCRTFTLSSRLQAGRVLRKPQIGVFQNQWVAHIICVIPAALLQQAHPSLRAKLLSGSCTHAFQIPRPAGIVTYAPRPHAPQTCTMNLTSCCVFCNPFSKLGLRKCRGSTAHSEALNCCASRFVLTSQCASHLQSADETY